MIICVLVTGSEKVAVMLICCEGDIITLSILSSNEIKVGESLSTAIEKVKLSVPKYAIPAKSVPETVTETSVETVEETVQL